MTPPQSTGFAAPTDESVAGLVAEPESVSFPYCGKINFDDLGSAVMAATIYAAPHPYEFDPNYSHGHQMVRGINFNSLNRIVTWFVQRALLASEARATALEGERDIARSEAAFMRETSIKNAQERNAAEAQLARAREALGPIVDEFGCSITQYDKNGPDFTHRDGTEVFEVSVLLDRRELIDNAREALLSTAPADGRGDVQFLATEDGEFNGNLPEDGRDEVDEPCPVCGCEVRGQGGYLQCECPVAAADATPTSDLPSEARADGVKVRISKKTISDALGERYREVVAGSSGKSFGASGVTFPAAVFDEYADAVLRALTVPSSTAQTGDA